MRVRKRDRTRDSSGEGPRTSSQGDRRDRAKRSSDQSSNRSSQRNRGKGGSKPKSSSKAGQGGKASSGQGRKRSSQRNRRNRNRRQQPPKDGTSFWGDPSRLPPAQPDVRITDDPAAVPRSLGPPPLPGHESIADHYFAVVYDRAVTTAGALAAAGGMIDPEALGEELAD